MSPWPTLQDKQSQTRVVAPVFIVVCGGKNMNTPAVEESLQASQGCLFSFPDHKEPHSPIDVEEAYVGLTVH